LGNKLSILRRARGMKQYDLARTLEVSPSFLCKVEKGLLEPNEVFKKKCADLFNEKIEILFSLPEDKKGVILTANSENNSNNLWTVRLKKNLKQNKLAELLGCSPSYLSKIEKGFQEPNSAFKKKCAKILKIKEIELFPEIKSIQ
jgi:transcriptional regulator with XRE-family HTH domain